MSNFSKFYMANKKSFEINRKYTSNHLLILRYSWKLWTNPLWEIFNEDLLLFIMIISILSVMTWTVDVSYDPLHDRDIPTFTSWLTVKESPPQMIFTGVFQ